MIITEIQIKLVDESQERLRAFCAITIDNSFIIRDLKIIEGPNGPFVAMPSRKRSFHCPKCRHKNAIQSNFCNNCGTKLDSSMELENEQNQEKMYTDVAHPINPACREMIQSHILQAFEKARNRDKSLSCAN
ncbi:MAG: SpoVG family protein [Planctomycetia bacterium]|nr:SpoVG family protein [Planctomycetia bacterium]